jgi:hypothetical protein
MPEAMQRTVMNVTVEVTGGIVGARLIANIVADGYFDGELSWNATDGPGEFNNILPPNDAYDIEANFGPGVWTITVVGMTRVSCCCCTFGGSLGMDFSIELGGPPLVDD